MNTMVQINVRCGMSLVNESGIGNGHLGAEFIMGSGGWGRGGEERN